MPTNLILCVANAILFGSTGICILIEFREKNVTISNDAFDVGFGKKMMNFSTDIVVVLL